jgi:hypothetical protein
MKYVHEGGDLFQLRQKAEDDWDFVQVLVSKVH